MEEYDKDPCGIQSKKRQCLDLNTRSRESRRLIDVLEISGTHLYRKEQLVRSCGSDRHGGCQPSPIQLIVNRHFFLSSSFFSRYLVFLFLFYKFKYNVNKDKYKAITGWLYKNIFLFLFNIFARQTREYTLPFNVQISVVFTL